MASNRTSVKIKGLKELDRALVNLPKATARNTLNRVLMKRAEPMRAAAESNAPVKSGKLRNNILISKKAKISKGIRGEIAGYVKKGMARSEAVLKAKANQAAKGNEKAFAQIFMGVAADYAGAVAIEFGHDNVSPVPFMRGAFEKEKQGVIDGFVEDLGVIVNKAAKRYAKSQARKALK